MAGKLKLLAEWIQIRLLHGFRTITDDNTDDFSSQWQIEKLRIANYVSVQINSLPANSDFCCLLMIFANSLFPDQDRHSVGPDLDSNCLTF